MTILVRDIATLRQHISRWRAEGLSIALVPTMGALHEGHLALIDIATANAERVVVSAFVNPMQFAPNEDFEQYPRDLDADINAVEARGGHILFAPNTEEIYGDGFATRIEVGGVGEGLEANDRPGFLVGVATVVAKLLLQCAPDSAVFGEKDFQQLLVVRRLVLDLDIPVQILSCPIVRDEFGLALSSRNAYLSEEQTGIARKLNLVLREAGEKISAEEKISEVLERGESRLLQEGFDKVDYLELRDGESFDAVEALAPGDRPARLLAAVRLGSVRLIDNVPVR
ncbi:MAG: pantoate--beta-alanine ligase [Hyphomicrobiales bacterium]|nr:pantoate--beta-alanine ligase [Hyphomicrobiales bacterium]MCY4033537.1 pantoate--beta-alanine ligase [Hyphomicrobiales bacterium]